MRAIVDTGPLVAFFDRAERHHQWVSQRVKELEAPLLVCEPVITETMHLLSRRATAQNAILDLIRKGALSFAFRIEEHVGELSRFLQKYRDRPMSLADACILRMAEMYEHHAILTLDSDFAVYRKHGRVPLTLIHPAAAM
jgi:uncharacterized protein